MQFLLLFGLLAANTPTQYEILEHIKLNVEVELAKYANYTCVQTVERTYFEERNACLPNERHKPRVFMRDRLRLDVAVSEGREIYSWHGEAKFTSANIRNVIPNGPATSGQFSGFLRNIFSMPGTQFTFKGLVNIDGRPAYAFDYIVQLLRSTYLVEGRNHSGIVPFHGSFAADAETFELMQLNVIADEIPLTTDICSASTEMDYQMVNVSGQETLLPASYVMKIESSPDLYTVNRNEYSQCREFRGQSTLIFKPVDPVPTAATHHVTNQQLPSGLILRGALDYQIDDKSSYEGDAVRATLSQAVTLPDGHTTIPKGASLNGVISKMEEHTGELKYWLLGIKLERIESGQDSYLVNAWPMLGTHANGNSRFAVERAIAQQSQQAALHGWWFLEGSHFKLAKHASCTWKSFAPNVRPAE